MTATNGAEAVERARVMGALTLGWVVADLFYTDMPSPPTPNRDFAGDLPSASERSPMDRCRANLDHAGALVDALGIQSVVTAWAGARSVLDSALANQVSQSWRNGLEDAHVTMLGSLEASDTSLFHAYDLGRSLRKTCQLRSDVGELRVAFGTWRIATIQERLGDLTSTLPDHAANAVAASLGVWSNWINSDSLAAEKIVAESRQRLTRQGHLWLAVLTGEKDAVAMLDPENFLAASKRLSSKLAKVMSRLLLTYWWQVVLLALAIAGVIAAVVFSDKTSSVIASLGGLAAALGITRKGVVAEGEGVMKRLTDDLWNAELDLSIGDAITKLPRQTGAFGRKHNELPASIERVPAAGPDPPAPPT